MFIFRQSIILARGPREPSSAAPIFHDSIIDISSQFHKMATTRSLWKPSQNSVWSYRFPSWSGIRRISQLPPSPTPSFPVLDTCPPPTCACGATPAGLDIDQERSLSGTVAPYAQHVIINTGKFDWKSRIEDEEGPNLARELKALLGPKGRFHDVGRRCHLLNAACSSYFTFESILINMESSQITTS